MFVEHTLPTEERILRLKNHGTTLPPNGYHANYFNSEDLDAEIRSASRVTELRKTKRTSAATLIPNPIIRAEPLPGAGHSSPGPSSCLYSPNRSPNSSSTRRSSPTCSKAALASTLALVAAYQAGVSSVKALAGAQSLPPSSRRKPVRTTPMLSFRARVEHDGEVEMEVAL
jgi:hypothetical protein